MNLVFIALSDYEKETNIAIFLLLLFWKPCRLGFVNQEKKHIGVLVTHQEWHTIRQKCRRARMSISEYIRKQLRLGPAAPIGRPEKRP